MKSGVKNYTFALFCRLIAPSVLDAKKNRVALQRMIDGQTPGNTVGSKVRTLNLLVTQNLILCILS